MKVKIAVISCISFIGLFCFSNYIFHRLQFSISDLETHSEGIPKEKIYELNKKVAIVNSNCSNNIEEYESVNISYELDFEYPIFSFNGFFTVEEHLLSKTNERNRIIYATERFRKKFTIENVCYPKAIDDEVIVVFGFLDKNGNYYSWRVKHNVKLLKQNKTLKIYIPAKKDNYVSTPARIIK